MSEKFGTLNRTKKVAIFVETSASYGRGILEGVAEYLKATQNWAVFLERTELSQCPKGWIESNDWDGILCRQTTPEIAELLFERGIPVVDLNGRYEIPSLTWVGSDHKAIGAMGAEHLRNCGIRRFAFCGFTNELWSRLRKEGFQRSVAEYGGVCHLLESPWSERPSDYWEKDISRIRDWIQSLPKPIGIMAVNDVRALHLIEACNQLGVAIPEQVAVLGVDDERTLCDLALPRLSSILPDCQRIGFLAAELLDDIMSGSSQKVKRIALPPKKVIARPSTDTQSVDDPLVVKALKTMASKRGPQLSIDDIAIRLKVTRRTLEKRFEIALNRSLSESMRWESIKRIQKLLVDTDLTLDQIAKLTDYANSEGLKFMFKNNVGMSPGLYRSEIRRKDAAIMSSPPEKLLATKKD